MTKNPLINALAATLYIAIVALGMFYSPGLDIQEPALIIPIVMISLLTLSVAVMALVFFNQPFQLYFAGEKKRGLNLFLQTVAIFAVITILFLLILVFVV